MLTLIAKLTDLNEDGLWLVHLLRNDRYATIQGAEVRLDKFSEIPLRSLLTYEQRTRKFDANGAPRKTDLTPEQEAQLARSLKFYGDFATGEYACYSFSPVAEMYNQNNRYADSHYANLWRMTKAELDAIGMPRINLSKPNDSTDDAGQINRMGAFARWWIAFGGFESIEPNPERDRITQMVTDALFGRPAHAETE